jgi:hypothetical protein
MTTDDTDQNEPVDALHIPMSALDIAFHVLTQMLPPRYRLMISGPTETGEFTVAVIAPSRQGKIAGAKGLLADAMFDAANNLNEVLNG